MPQGAGDRPPLQDPQRRGGQPTKWRGNVEQTRRGRQAVSMSMCNPLTVTGRLVFVAPQDKSVVTVQVPK